MRARGFKYDAAQFERLQDESGTLATDVTAFVSTITGAMTRPVGALEMTQVGAAAGE
jgi:hypothetical protein